MNPEPFLTVRYPMSAAHPDPELKLIIEGENLVDESVVEFEGVPVEARLVMETMRLEAAIPPKLLTRYGEYRVFVKNPRPQGNISNVRVFFVGR